MKSKQLWMRNHLTSPLCGLYSGRRSGSQAGGRGFKSPLKPLESLPGRYTDMRRCDGLYISSLQFKESLGLFEIGREFFPSPEFLPSCCGRRET